MPVREKVSAYMEAHGLVEGGETVVCGVSGGADSVALLLIMHELGERLGFKVCAAHYNHMIRGAEADGDEAYVEELCRKLGVELIAGRGDVPGEAKANGQTLETAARLMRYAFLEHVREEKGAKSIAVAHHMDDQAESIMLHITRGSGLKGLKGMQPRYGNIIRPLLCLRRSEIEAFLAAQGTRYCTDSTNLELEGTRNRLRLDVIPYIEGNINPQFTEALVALGELASEDEALLDGMAKQALREAARDGGYDRALLRGLKRPIMSRAIRLALDEAGAHTDIERKHVDMIAALLSAGTGAHADVPHAEAWNEYGVIRFGRERHKSGDNSIALKLDGETETPMGTFFACTVEGNAFKRDRHTAYMDMAKLPDGLVIRTRRDGDRFYPVGATGTRKLKEFFIDRKVPREQREVPMICSGGNVLFIPGFGVSDTVKATESTVRMLKVTIMQREL